MTPTGCQGEPCGLVCVAHLDEPKSRCDTTAVVREKHVQMGTGAAPRVFPRKQGRHAYCKGIPRMCGLVAQYHVPVP